MNFKRVLILVFALALFSGVLSAADLSQKIEDISLGLFSGGNVTTASNLSLGDLVGAIFIGIIAYLTTVVFFIIGLVGVGGYFFKAAGGGGDNLAGMNFVRLALKPLLWFVVGAVIFATFKIFLEGWYNIDIGSRIKFFFEARYDSLVDNLTTTGVMLKSTKTVLTILDLLSKFAFWSIVAIFIFLYVFVFGVFLSVFIESGNADASIFKKILAGVFTAVISLVIIGMYNANVSRVMFSKNPVIESVGEVRSINQGFTSAIKIWVEKGLKTS
ncbi:MAG: hypothetical protein A3F91_09230 [Flavobacteria bacterium RIFCSPLOWO2_12_FULL_35_11]|nr:MAG: hypothetical protein A3F91_09230 [Flavobacteria bacterium RIFCSPLOWO2_12_FULL_35_11]